jgi:DNA mismatch endonuclease (patch repair protein)
MDRITSAQRSAIMAAVKGKNTTPEITVRRLAHRLGFRFRLHSPHLPGRPDLAFPRLRKVIFVNGCFWHAHHCRRGKRIPETNRDYWIRKRRRNANRDRRVAQELQKLGWEVLTIWECETRDVAELAERIVRFLTGRPV